MLAACWSVEVIKGGLGFVLIGFFTISSINKFELRIRVSIFFASSFSFLSFSICDLSAAMYLSSVLNSYSGIGVSPINNISFLDVACRDFPNKIVIGIDARKGKVSIEGWTKDSGVNANELAINAEKKGVCAIIFTDIDKDGLMSGPNISSTLEIAKAVNIPVIVSGGVSAIEDVIEVKENEGSGIGGVICGRAVYDKKVDIKEALKIVRL